MLKWLFKDETKDAKEGPVESSKLETKIDVSAKEEQKLEENIDEPAKLETKTDDTTKEFSEEQK